PDADHPYGHHRYETLAAAGIGMLLLLTAYEVGSGIVERLFNPVDLAISPLTYGVLIATLIANLFITRYEHRAGQRLRSPLLLADAAHTGADAFVTLSVLAGVILTSLGLRWADPVAALFVIIVIVRAAWQILRKTGRVLVDEAPYPEADLRRAATSVEAVETVLRARSRGTVDAAHVDIDIQIPPEMTADHASAIAGRVREKIQQAFPGVNEVEVHFEPAAQAGPDYLLITRARADAHGLNTHELRLTEGADGLILDMHVEAPPTLSLAEAHARVSALEDDLHARMPGLARIDTHIEPALIAHGVGSEPEPEAAFELAERAMAHLQVHLPGSRWHDPSVTLLPDGSYALALHAALPSDLSLEEAHRQAETAELLLRTHFPSIARVTIHTEPYERT
ncbi:MAG: cation-efflux pump, partial [Anaerolinea sp.]|nr:cation-efflux pump [Anaerolinea sp.]